MDRVGLPADTKAIKTKPVSPSWVVDLSGWLWGILSSYWQLLVGGASVYFLNKLFRRLRYPSYSVSVGLPFNLGSRTYDTTPWDRIVAWKLYVQLVTRKAALPFDENYDLISEVYDSLFAIFGVTRDLLLQLPPHEFEREDGVAPLLLRVMNDGLRPHLTRWQSDFRKWWGEAVDARENVDKSPQEIQRQYPHYTELVADLRQTNTELSKLTDELLSIARARKQKVIRPAKVVPLPPIPEHPVETPATIVPRSIAGPEPAAPLPESDDPANKDKR